jgi:hypothetical protein
MAKNVPNPTKPKKIGRPKLPKGEAKGKIVPIRFAPEDLKAITAAAKASKQTLSQWIRSAVQDSLLAKLETANQDHGSRSNESRHIRRELRNLGHRGGLGNRIANAETK